VVSEARLGGREFLGLISLSGKKVTGISFNVDNVTTATLMPPTQPFVPSRISGYVCRACLSNLRRPQRPQTPWLIRYASNGPSRAKPSKKTEEPPIKYFEQTPDGTRTEAVDNSTKAAILKDVEEQIQRIEEEGGDQGDDLVGEDEPSPVELLSHIGKQYDVPESMRSAMEEMEAQMANAANLESLSEEERASLRNRLLNFEGMRSGSSGNACVNSL
jgi:hypothetical protein